MFRLLMHWLLSAENFKCKQISDSLWYNIFVIVKIRLDICFWWPASSVGHDQKLFRNLLSDSFFS